MWTQTQVIQAISQDNQVQNDLDVNLRCLQPHVHLQLHHQEVKGLEVKVILSPSGAGDNMEHGVHTFILSRQLNTKCNTRDNVTNKEKSNPRWGELAR